MKYIKYLTFSILLFCQTAFSAGIYDGIWNIDNLGYASIHQKGEKLIFILLDGEANEDGDYLWEAYWGDLIENKSTQITLISGVLTELELVFETETKLKIELKSCTPQTGDCDEPVGTTFGGQRIW